MVGGGVSPQLMVHWAPEAWFLLSLLKVIFNPLLVVVMSGPVVPQNLNKEFIPAKDKKGK